MKQRNSSLILTTRDTAKFVLETGLIPVPNYKENDYRETIIPCSSIYEEKRKVKRLGKKKKPIEF